MKPRVVVDTNVVVAGLLTSDPASPVARVLEGMLSAAFVFAVSGALLAEYHQVLVRPALRRRHGLSTAEVELLLAEIALHAIMLQTVPGPPPTPATNCCGTCSPRAATSCSSPATRSCWPMPRCGAG